MPLPQDLKTPNQYSMIGLSDNPFKIEPLFRDFRNQALCKRHEELFVPPGNLRPHLKNLCTLEDRRCLIYGGYGAGKTSLVDMILYVACTFHHRFCVRVVVTEDNVVKAINEMLVAVCLQLIDEIAARPLLHPIKSIRKWLLERRVGDNLLKSMARLIGPYTEEETRVVKSSKKGMVQASPMGIGAGLNVEEETEIRRSIQSYVQVLPMPTISRYLDELHALSEQIGYTGISIFIDEADHLAHIDAFLKMLTKAREVLFAQGYTFFIAGSPEIARHVEDMGIIFDKIFFMEPASRDEFEEILTCRIRSNAPKLAISSVFAPASLDLIYEATKGMRKQFIRLAENSLDIAVAQELSQVTASHVREAIHMAKDQIHLTLSPSQSKVMKILVQHEPCSPSDKKLQTALKLGRAAIRNALEELVDQGYVTKQKQGRLSLYSVAITYKPYFAG